MDTEKFDTIVLGAGAMGSSAMVHLARRGVRVLGLERFDPGHARGSSHGYSRAIRLCYYEHPDYVPLLRRAYELWRELERESGERLLHVTGGVYMGRRGCEVVEGSRRAGELHGLPHEMLTRGDLASRFPQFNVPDDFEALYEPNAGFLVPERVIAANMRGAISLGAMVQANERVLSWRGDGGEVDVTTTGGRYRGRRLIIAAGAYANQVLGELVPRVNIVPTRQVLGWVDPPRREVFEVGRLPVWAIAKEDGGLYYGFPMASTTSAADADALSIERGMKLALHARGPEADPETMDWTPRAEDEGTFRPALRQYLPDADGPVVSMRVCMYENSPDGHFIIDRHPQHPNVLIAAGFSGHGFKFASVVGEVLAEMALEGATRHPVGFLGLGRFGRE